jgi:hypothetical protein
MHGSHNFFCIQDICIETSLASSIFLG